MSSVNKLAAIFMKTPLIFETDNHVGDGRPILPPIPGSKKGIRSQYGRFQRIDSGENNNSQRKRVY